MFSINLGLECLALDQLGNILIIFIAVLLTLTFLLLHVLVALGEFAEGGEGVGAELVQDAGYEFGEFFLFTVAVDGEGVAGDGGLDYVGGRK